MVCLHTNSFTFAPFRPPRWSGRSAADGPTLGALARTTADLGPCPHVTADVSPGRAPAMEWRPHNVSAYLTVFTRGTPGPRNGSVRLRTRLVVVLPNSASSSTISSRWAIDVATTFMT